MAKTLLKPEEKGAMLLNMLSKPKENHHDAENANNSKGKPPSEGFISAL